MNNNDDVVVSMNDFKKRKKVTEAPSESFGSNEEMESVIKVNRLSEISVGELENGRPYIKVSFDKADSVENDRDFYEIALHPDLTVESVAKDFIKFGHFIETRNAE